MMRSDGAARASGVILAILLSVGFSPAARAACVLPLENNAVEGFVAKPAALLNVASSDDQDLIFQVRGFAVTTDGARKAIAGLAKEAGASQKFAIGRGLAVAYLACTGQSTGTARKIGDLVRAIDDANVTRGYVRVVQGAADDENPAPDAAPEAGHSSRLGYGDLAPAGLSNPMDPVPLPGDYLLGK